MSKLAKAVVREALLVGVCALSGWTKSLKKELVNCWTDPRKRLRLAGWLGTFVFLFGYEHTPETLDDALGRLRADLFQAPPLSLRALSTHFRDSLRWTASLPRIGGR